MRALFARFRILPPSVKCSLCTFGFSLLAVAVFRSERRETLPPPPIYYSNQCSEATLFMYSCFYLFMRFHHANIRASTINFLYEPIFDRLVFKTDLGSARFSLHNINVNYVAPIRKLGYLSFARNSVGLTFMAFAMGTQAEHFLSLL